MKPINVYIAFAVASTSEITQSKHGDRTAVRPVDDLQNIMLLPSLLHYTTRAQYFDVKLNPAYKCDL